MNHLSSIIIAALDSLALSSTQTDDVIKLIGKLVDTLPQILGLVGTFLTLCASGFLIIRQYLNKSDIDKKIAANTDLTHEVKAVAVESVKKADAAYNEANNVNVKLASLGIQTKPTLGDSAENPIHTVTP